MKVLTKVTEIEGEGLPSLLGKKVMLRTVGFTYSGVLIGVNDTCVKLEQPATVFDTDKGNVPSDFSPMKWPVWYVQLGALEGFCAIGD